jgi:hypothetical protein
MKHATRGPRRGIGAKRNEASRRQPQPMKTNTASEAAE